MKVYSPSSTRTHAFCPTARALQQQGLTPKYAAKGAVARWMGTAMAAGLEQHNNMRRRGAPHMVTPYQAAAVKWDEEVSRFLDAGGVVTDETYETRIPPLMQRALEKYAAQDIIPATWSIEGVEQAFQDGGNARGDVIVRDEEGLAPLDYKMKETLYVKPGETRDAARSRTLMELGEEYDWNQKHYMWCIRRFLGQPCTHHYLVLGELSPTPRFTLQRFDVSERAMQQWIDSAWNWWGDLCETEIDHINAPRMAPTHTTKYGKCEFYDACITYELDAERYRHKYITINRSTHL
mgnify:CR=1 FL=1